MQKKENSNKELKGNSANIFKNVIGFCRKAPEKSIMIASGFILLIMFLFPPFKTVRPCGVSVFAGYHFITTRIATFYINYDKWNCYVKINSFLLFIQVVIVIFITLIVLYVIKQQRNKEQ